MQPISNNIPTIKFSQIYFALSYSEITSSINAKHPTMSEMCNLQIQINGQHTFFLSERILSKYSGKLRKIIKQEKRRTQIKNSGIEIDDFPGGPDGIELISRFCYNRGSISITVSNVSLLHCCAVFLGMTEKASRFNLLHQTEEFLEGIFYWSWTDVLTSLKNCESFFNYAESCGLIEKLLCSLLAKIAQNSDVNFLSVALSSSSSSPETERNLSSPVVFNGSLSKKPYTWWFQDLTSLSPRIIEQFLRALGSYGSDNNNLVLTRFLLHYLKTSLHSNGSSVRHASTDYGCLADTMVHGVVLMGKTAFSCRGLFWVLRIVSGFGVSRESLAALERLIGGMLDQAKLDDLLVSGGGNGGVYDVNFVLRLVRLFLHYYDKMSLDKMKKVGELIDMYLGEIGPDPNLKITKFIGVAESLPDCARDCFDQVYRAIDIYIQVFSKFSFLHIIDSQCINDLNNESLFMSPKNKFYTPLRSVEILKRGLQSLQSHPSLSLEETSRLCRCLNYEKLSLEACKDLAKNPRIPPRITVQALASQHSHVQMSEFENDDYDDSGNNKCISNSKNYQLVLYKPDNDTNKLEMECSVEDKEEMRVNLERMQWRVVELEKVCREMKGQMAKMVKLAPQQSRPLPRLC